MNSITGKEFIKKLIGFSTASWISAVISFFSTPLITRLFLPAEVGKINLFTTYMALFQTICILGLDQAYMRFFNEYNDDKARQKLLGFCLSFSLIMAVVCSSIILMHYDYFSVAITGKVNFNIAFFLVISVFSSISLRITSIASRMEQKVFSYTLQTISITFIEKVIFSLIAFYEASHFMAIATMSYGYMIVAGIFLFAKRKSLYFNWNLQKNEIFDLFKFAIPYLPVLLLSWLNNTIPQFFLKEYVNYGAIGIYTNAVSIANILTIIQTGFNVYWAPFAYENYLTQRKKLEKVHKCISFLLILFALLIIFNQDIIYLLLGEKYRVSKSFFAFLIISPVCISISDTTGIGIMLHKKSYLNIFSFIGSTITNVVLCTILVPKSGIVGGAIAAGTASVAMLIIRTWLGGKFYRMSKSYLYLVFSMTILYAAAVINLLFSNLFFIREFGVFCCILLIMLIYKKEFIYLMRFLINGLKRCLGRV